MLVFVEVKARASLDDAAEVGHRRDSSGASSRPPKPGSPTIPTTAIRDIRFDAMLVAPGKMPRHIPAAFET